MEGKYQVVEEIVRIHVSIPQVAAENASKNILFVLDNSYSMNASWNSIKEAVEYMLALQAFTPHFIVYSTTAARKTGAEVLKMDVDYTTNFVAAFEEIEKFVNETNDKNIDVVFMTDGCDTCNDKHKIVQQLKSFSHFLAESKKGVTIHTIGSFLFLIIIIIIIINKYYYDVPIIIRYDYYYDYELLLFYSTSSSSISSFKLLIIIVTLLLLFVVIKYYYFSVAII